MRRFLTCVFVVTLLFPSVESLAQETADEFRGTLFYELNGYAGKNLDIHPFFPETGTSTTTELNVNWKTRGRLWWYQTKNYPEVGFSFSYSTFGNQEVLGSSIGIVPTVARQFSLFEKTFISLRGGGGLAYFNKPFDAISNPENLVIGSRITALAAFNVGIVKQFNEHWAIRAGGSFWHYSNSHLRVPNIGANVVAGNIGLRYFPSGQSSHWHEQQKADIDNRWMYNVAVGTGWHEVEGTVYPYDGPLHPVYFSSFYVSKRTNPNSQLDLGLTGNYYTAFYDQIRDQELFDPEDARKNSYKLIAFAGKEFFFGRFAFAFWMGGNLYFPHRERLIELGVLEPKTLHRHMSNKIAAHYYFKSTRESTRFNPYLSLELRSIGGKADFLGISVGMAFRGERNRRGPEPLEMRDQGSTGRGRMRL